MFIIRSQTAHSLNPVYEEVHKITLLQSICTVLEERLTRGAQRCAARSALGSILLEARGEDKTGSR